jgi:hypothetical protein
VTCNSLDKANRRVYSDHSAFTQSTGLTDLRSLLSAYTHTHPNNTIGTIPMIAGLLLIHCVAEDAYYLLSGIVDGLMRDHFHGNGVVVDSNVFAGVLGGSEKALSRKFKDLGIHRELSSLICFSVPCFSLHTSYVFELILSTTIPD